MRLTQGVERSGTTERLELAGRAVRIRTAGDQLAGSFEPALAHVRSVSTVGPPRDLDIVAWDATSTGIPGPELPWRVPGLPPGTRLTAPAAARGFRIAGATPADGVHLFDPVTGRAAWLLPDEAHLPTFHYAGSFAAIGGSWEVDPEAWWRDVTVNLRGPMLTSVASRGRGP